MTTLCDNSQLCDNTRKDAKDGSEEEAVDAAVDMDVIKVSIASCRLDDVTALAPSCGFGPRAVPSG